MKTNQSKQSSHEKEGPIMHTCDKCKCETDLWFCPECGNIIEFPDIVAHEAKMQKELREYVKNMVLSAQKNHIDIAESIDKSVLSDLQYRKYYQHIAYLQTLCDEGQSKSVFGWTGNDITAFAQKCITNECQIAIVGTIKAGKSTFLNALLDKEIASEYPTPETSTVTRFRSSNNGDYVKITYYNDTEWNSLWESVRKSSKSSFRDDDENFLSEYQSLEADKVKNQYINRHPDVFYPKDLNDIKQLVNRFTSAHSTEHFFAKEVEVGLSDLETPANVVFVDTPGLNDPVRFRSDITQRYLRSANVILLCIKAGDAALNSIEVEQINGVFEILRYQKERIYIIGTQFDLQDDPLDYWDRHTFPEFIKYLSKEHTFGKKENFVQEHLFPVSAKYYGMIRHAQESADAWDDDTFFKAAGNMVRKCIAIPRNCNISIEKIFYDNVTKLIDFTNINNVRNILMKGPVADADKITMDDIINGYNHILRLISYNATRTQEMNENTIDKYKKQEIQKQIDIWNQKINESTTNFEKIEETLQKTNTEVINLINNLKTK